MDKEYKDNIAIILTWILLSDVPHTEAERMVFKAACKAVGVRMPPF